MTYFMIAAMVLVFLIMLLMARALIAVYRVSKAIQAIPQLDNRWNLTVMVIMKAVFTYIILSCIELLIIGIQYFTN